MKKPWIRAGLIGMLAGIAIHDSGSVLISYALRLRYLMPYPAMMPEMVGGELNATLIVLALSALMGAGIGIAISLVHHRRAKFSHRGIAALCSLAVGITPLIIIAISFAG